MRGKEKTAVGFFTYSWMPGKSEETFSQWCKARGMHVAGTMVILMKDIDDEKKRKELAAVVNAAIRGQ
jgi:hypothetical protein